MAWRADGWPWHPGSAAERGRTEIEEEEGYEDGDKGEDEDYDNERNDNEPEEAMGGEEDYGEDAAGCGKGSEFQSPNREKQRMKKRNNKKERRTIRSILYFCSRLLFYFFAKLLLPDLWPWF